MGTPYKSGYKPKRSRPGASKKRQTREESDKIFSDAGRSFVGKFFSTPQKMQKRKNKALDY